MIACLLAAAFQRREDAVQSLVRTRSAMMNAALDGSCPEPPPETNATFDLSATPKPPIDTRDVADVADVAPPAHTPEVAKIRGVEEALGSIQAMVLPDFGEAGSPGSPTERSAPPISD